MVNVALTTRITAIEKIVANIKPVVSQKSAIKKRNAASQKNAAKITANKENVIIITMIAMITAANAVMKSTQKTVSAAIIATAIVMTKWVGMMTAEMMMIEMIFVATMTMSLEGGTCAISIV